MSACKKVSVRLQKSWLKDQPEGAAPVEGMIAHFCDTRTDWQIDVLSQSPGDGLFLVRAEGVEDAQILSLIKDYFEQKHGVAKDDDVVGIKVTEMALPAPAQTATGGEEAPAPRKDVSKLIDGFRTRKSGAAGVPEVLADMSDLASAKEFKELLEEYKKVAPQITQHGTHEVFASQSYLFSVNEGYGLTSYLGNLVDTVTGLGLFQAQKNQKLLEIELEAPADERERRSALNDAVEKVGRCVDKYHLICFDISAWMPRVKEDGFARFLRALDKHTGKVLFAFRVPFLEKDALDNVRRVLSDVFTIRPVSFSPFSTQELVRIAETNIQEKGFHMHENTIPVFTARIAEEKRDGKFYGIQTVRKVVREMIYLKQLASVDAEAPDTEIQQPEILALSEDYSAQNQSGMDQLDALIGLDSLKQRIREIVAQIEITRNNKSLETPCIHMRFTGNPGTGKTTVARILGKILTERGILRNGNFFEYSGRDFCGRYVGETAPKTAAMCRDAYGSVLFIDEAYSLYSGDDDSRDYGREALTTLIAEMENHRTDLMVIMAGYTDDMDRLLKGNAGLESRMPYKLEFPNYNQQELARIFMAMAGKGFAYGDDFATVVQTYFDAMPAAALQAKEFSNARFVRNLYERTWGKAILREQLTDSGGKLILRAEDFLQASGEGEFQALMEKKTKRIGF